MAGENARMARYRRVIEEDIPVFVGDIERLFVSLLKSLSKKQRVEERGVAYNVIYQLTREMSKRMRKMYWDDHVLWKIMQLRLHFVRFRRFIDLWSVNYDEANNQVDVAPNYFVMLPNQREPDTWATFRATGCPYYKNLRIIFVYRKFHLLIDEPNEVAWHEILWRVGDDPLPQVDYLNDPDDDSDDDSDYGHEFDD